MYTRAQLFEAALVALRAGREQEAWCKLEKVVEGGSMEPRHLSYYGLLLATRKKRLEEGLECCGRAYLLAPTDPEMLLNMAKIHAHTGRKSKAVRILRRALRAHPGDRAVRAELLKLSERRPPVVGSLGRDHVVNRVLGVLRARMRPAPDRHAG